MAASDSTLRMRDSNARLFHQFHRGPGEPQVPPLGLKPRVGMTAFHFERAQLQLRRHDFPLYCHHEDGFSIGARTSVVPTGSYNFRLNPALRHPTPIRAKAARLGDPGSAACWAKLFRACGAGLQPVVPGGDRRGELVAHCPCGTSVVTQPLQPDEGSAVCIVQWKNITLLEPQIRSTAQSPARKLGGPKFTATAPLRMTTHWLRSLEGERLQYRRRHLRPVYRRQKHFAKLLQLLRAYTRNFPQRIQ